MFNMGFEFEIKTSLSKYRLKRYLNTSLPKWSNELTIAFDCSIGKKGWEIVTPPWDNDVALSRCRDIFYVLQAHNDISTDKECGFHVNISFSDSRKTNKVDYIKLSKNVPTYNILAQFGRTQNPFTLRHEYILKETFFEASNALLSFSEARNILTNENAASEFLSSIMQDLRTNVNEKMSEFDKGSSIVEKKFKNKRYFEFRMIGNNNYHFRWQEIKSCITKIKSAMIKSI